MQCTGFPPLSCRAVRCGCIVAESTAVLFSLLQSLLFRHCDSVAAQHAVCGPHQHAVESSLCEVVKMFLHAVAVAVAIAVAVGVAVAVAVITVQAPEQCKQTN